MRQPDIEPATWAYLRLHGRNATAWWHSQDRDERYRYAYAENELALIAERLMRTVSATRTAYAYLNNHPNARAVQNATMLKALVGQETTTLPEVLQTEETRPLGSLVSRRDSTCSGR